MAHTFSGTEDCQLNHIQDQSFLVPDFDVSQITDFSRGEILTHIRRLLVTHQCWLSLLNLIDGFNFLDIKIRVELACVATSSISLLERCVLSRNFVTYFEMYTSKKTSSKKCFVLKGNYLDVLALYWAD